MSTPSSRRRQCAATLCIAISNWLPKELRARPFVERTFTHRCQPSELSSVRAACSRRSRSAWRRSARSMSVSVRWLMEHPSFRLLARAGGGGGPPPPPPPAQRANIGREPAAQTRCWLPAGSAALQTELLGSHGRPARPGELVEAVDRPGAVQPGETVGGAHAELAGELILGARPRPVTVQQEQQDGPVVPVLLLGRGGYADRAWKARPFRATAPGSSQLRGGQLFRLRPRRVGGVCDGILKVRPSPASASTGVNGRLRQSRVVPARQPVTAP